MKTLHVHFIYWTDGILNAASSEHTNILGQITWKPPRHKIANGVVIVL